MQSGHTTTAKVTCEEAVSIPYRISTVGSSLTLFTFANAIEIGFQSPIVFLQSGHVLSLTGCGPSDSTVSIPYRITTVGSFREDGKREVTPSFVSIPYRITTVGS